MKHRRSLRVLHLASFAGNIGDLANHAGTRYMLDLHLDYDFQFTELEIREFYWKLRSFDDEFVRWANSFDLLMIGGGNYFELWVDHSATGTSLDITAQRLAALTVPTLFYSLGVDTGQGYSDRSVNNFRGFLNSTLERDDMFVCVRNDGSSKALTEVVGSATANRIPIMPDGGFFSGAALDTSRQPTYSKRIRIGINIAGDMLERRFAGMSWQQWLGELANCCEALLEERPEVDIELIPHIWRDCVVIAQLLPLIADFQLRRRVVVRGLQPTAQGLADFIGTYAHYALVLGMRFHANVCPIGMGIPSRGLLSYPQVGLLYDELEMPDRLIDVQHNSFCSELRDLTIADLHALPQLQARYGQCVGRVRHQAASVLTQLNGWMHHHYG